MPPRSQVSPTRKLLNEFEGQTEAQKHIIQLLELYYVENIQDHVLRARVVQDIPWMLFGHQDVQSNLDIYRKLREYLTRRDITVAPIATSGNMVAYKVIQSIWTGPDRDHAARVFQTHAIAGIKLEPFLT